MLSSSRSTGKCLPISCQACRTRKIRCTRDGRPCQTCVRRGLGAGDCIYLGQPRLSTEQTQSRDPNVQHGLLSRIRNLEGLLQKQVNPQVGTPVGAPSSPLGALSASSSLSGSGLGGGPDPWDLRTTMLGNIGFLHTSSSGNVRYVPLASQWESVVAKSPAAQLLWVSDTEIVDDDDLQIPLARNGSVSRSELLVLLPPSRYCDNLKKVYFEVVSPIFHVLHDLTFEAEYQQFCHNPSSISTSWLALLFAILAIAVSAMEDDDPLLSDLGRERTVGRNIKVLSARYRSAALRCLAADGVMTRHSINSLQTLVLVGYARLHRGLPFWTLLGLTHHVAISMGCHIDPEKFYLGPIEREERRRVWAGLMMLYTIQNSYFGSFDQQSLTQNVRMPADVDDIDILNGSNMSKAFDLASSSSSGRPTHMTCLILSLRLQKLSNRICESIFTYPQASSLIISQLQADLMSFREICDIRYQVGTNPDLLPVHHHANLNILYSQIHQLTLLLLRPNLHRLIQGEVTRETIESREKCLASAKGSLSIFQEMLENPDFAPYKWYTSGLGSFSAFHAAVVLAISLLNAETQAEFDETKEGLNKALEMFASVSVRSSFSSKAFPILQHIIMEITSTEHHQAQQQSRVQFQTQQTQAQMFSTLAPIVPSVTISNGSVPPQSQYVSPVPTVMSSAGDPTMQSSFDMSLQARHWNNPHLGSIGHNEL